MAVWRWIRVVIVSMYLKPVARQGLEYGTTLKLSL
jgi:hypothetical protein